MHVREEDDPSPVGTFNALAAGRGEEEPSDALFAQPSNARLEPRTSSAAFMISPYGKWVEFRIRESRQIGSRDLPPTAQGNRLVSAPRADFNPVPGYYGCNVCRPAWHRRAPRPGPRAAAGPTQPPPGAVPRNTPPPHPPPALSAPPAPRPPTL